MAKPYPVDFRRDVVAVSRKRETPLRQIANDFGISDACLHNWPTRADVKERVKPGVIENDAAALREARRQPSLLEQKAEVMRRAVVYLSKNGMPK